MESEVKFEVIDGRLERIEDRLETVVTGQAELRADMRELRTGHTELRADVGELRAGHEALRADVRELKTGYAELRKSVDDVRHEMHVLHEDVLDRIAALPTDVVTHAQMQRGLDELEERIGRRLDPLTLAVRELIRRDDARH
ncbi:MAG TPA: hypothetical protein VGJ29_14425 [Vicinamibacterales bacterium]|jgi:chromosome segregation ATPase